MVLGCSAYPACKRLLPDDKGKPGTPRARPVLSEHVCPVCGKALILRTGAKGEFFGCSGYPACKANLPCRREWRSRHEKKEQEMKRILLLSVLCLSFASPCPASSCQDVQDVAGTAMQQRNRCITDVYNTPCS